MTSLYQFYRVSGLEWVIISVVIADGLYRLSSEANRKTSEAVFLLINAAFCAAMIPPARKIPFSPLFQTQGAAIWVFFVILLLGTLLSSALLLKGNFPAILGYDIFYVVLILLFKMICGPLYAAEPILSAGLYRFLDLSLTVILFLILLCMTALFLRIRLELRPSFLPKAYALILLFPVGLFCFLFLYVTGIPISPNAERSILCGILLINLPIVYYIFASIIREYNERSRLDRALLKTQVELDHYRFAAELNEKIRKERHELKNNYFYLRMLLEEGEIQKADEYLNRILGESLPALDHVSTGNTMLDHILNQTLAEARSRNIPVSTEIIVQKDLPISEDILCTILLNLFHNAMEACEAAQQKDLRITIKEVRNYLLCKVANRVDKDILKENPSLSSTKQDKENHGLGLKIVASKIEQCNGSFEAFMQDGYFTATAMLPLFSVPDNS